MIFRAPGRLLFAGGLLFLVGCASSPGKKNARVIDVPSKTGPGNSQTSSSKSHADSLRAAPPAAAKSPPKSASGASGASTQPASEKPPVTVAKPANAAPRSGEPLIMENADRMEGSRSRGEFVLVGHVRFSHGQLRLETERAVWEKERNLVHCESGMKIVHSHSTLTADGGSYDKVSGQAVAEGNVRMRDSSGEVEAFAKTVVYNRQKHLITMTGKPELRRYYPKKPARDSGGVPADSKPVADAPKDSVADTLVIRGQTMTYDDSLRVAVAEGSVRITRDKLRIDCKRAEYHEQADSLYLIGEPQVQVDDSKVKGQIMRLSMHGEEIRSLLVKGAAQAHSLDPATDTTAARQSDVEGDSLFLAFKEKAIDSVQVFRNAKGSYFDVDKPDYINRMSGEYMVLRFAGRQVQSANVMGGAKSTYYHIETRKLKGRNEAAGDTIDFAFHEGRIEEVMVRGNAKGNYFGEGGKSGKALAPDTVKAGKPAAKGPAAAGAAAQAKDSSRSAHPALRPDAKAAVKPAAQPAAGPSPATAQPAQASPSPRRKIINPQGRK